MREVIDREFNLRDGLIYLNHAAVSPWPARSVKAVQAFAEENMIKGSLEYPQWLNVENNLRRQAQKLINAPSKDDIALVKNTSEALSFVACGLDWKEGDNVVSSNQEFPSNRIVWESLDKRGVEFREADLSMSQYPEDALFSLVDDRTRLITISSVQYSSGLRMGLIRIGEFCKKREILFCIDAIQSLGALQFDVKEINADFVMADGHKWMLGPEGLGFFYSHSDARNLLSLNQFGWHMIEDLGNFDSREWTPAGSARRFECGSPNMLGIHALNASLSLLLEVGMKNIEKEVLKRSEYLFEKINSQPDLELITPADPGHYAGIVTFRHLNADNAMLFQYLINNYIFCSLRSGAIRVSPHFYTPYEHLDLTIDMVMKYNHKL